MGSSLESPVDITDNNNNNTPICKASKALASEALTAGQSWMLIKVLMEEVHFEPILK